jgi:hypothetical protein
MGMYRQSSGKTFGVHRLPFTVHRLVAQEFSSEGNESMRTSTFAKERRTVNGERRTVNAER